MSGWYIMHRGWMDSFRPEPFTDREAFLWSIEQAAIKAHDQWFNGQKIPVARGEFATSLRTMAEAFSWTVKRVRGFMERMGKAQKWAQRQAHSGAQSPTIITVCNYREYQDVSDEEGTSEGTVEGTQRAQSGHSRGTQQNKGNKGNKGKKKEDSPSDSSICDAIDARGDGPPVPEDPLVLLPAPDEVTEAFQKFEALRSEWVAGCRPLALGPDRRKKLALRLRDIGGAAGWGDVLAHIRGSPFLRGETSRTGFTQFDWLLEPKNLRKVVEGNYDDRGHSPSRTAASVRSSPVDALAFARVAGGFE